MKSPRHNTEDSTRQRVDEALRRDLEPSAATVERLVRQALAHAEAKTGDRSAVAPQRRTNGAGRAWHLAAAGALAALALVAIALWIPSPFTVPVFPPAEETHAEPAAARLTISNPDGILTVTSTAGSKWIILHGDPS